ncbi:hypothetical protein CEE44_02625 [Candidatus Woesearchaeota archaeon B3_Woes]|nr:MAG: hypothetical protein CEE44_02625 [Candidatus Woesearchaeota archaeon B3_Woes]
MALNLEGVILSIIIGTLAAIVYSLRVLVLMERRVSRIEGHIETIAAKILREELRIEKALKIRKTTTKKAAKRKKKKK